MFKEFLKNPRALVYAVSIHVVLLLILVMSLKWNTKPAPLQGSGEIVKAVVIDEAKLQEEKQRKRQEEQRKRDAEVAKRRAAELQRQAEEQKQRAAEQHRREAQQAAEKKKQLIAEQKRQAKIKADKEAKERQRIAEQKRQAEQEAKRKTAAEAEAKRKAEEKRKADEARRQRENLEMMKQQMAQEEADRAAQARAEQQRRELATKMNQYALQLKNIVQRNWIRPPTSRSGLICTVHVRLIPGGEVVDAHVTKSSGDAAFDRSAETAVLKSSPLPIPPDPSLREFDFIYNPEG